MLNAFVAFSVALYFSNAHLYFWWAGYSAIKPLHWYLFTIGGGAVLLALRTAPIAPTRAGISVAVWGVAMAALCGASYVLVSDGGRETLQALITAVEGLALLVVLVWLLAQPGAWRVASRSLAVIVVAAVLINYYDFAVRGSVLPPLSLIPGRAAGLYLDANSSGYALAYGMLLTVPAIPRRLRWLYCLFIGTGVLVTFSRSSIMLWALAWLCLAWYRAFSLPRLPSVALAAALLVGGSAALAGGAIIELGEELGFAHLLDENTAGRIAGSFTSQEDESTKDRARVARRGFDAFLSAPVVGHGIGSLSTPAFDTEPHNEYLAIGAELGIIGLLMFGALFPLLWHAGTPTARSMALLYAFGCLFLHFLLSEPGVQVALAMAATAPPLAPADDRAFELDWLPGGRLAQHA